MQKQIYLIAAIAALLIAMPSVSDQVFAAKPTKCNNVKVQVRVNGVEQDEVVVASATIGTKAVTKTSTVEANETSITIPLNFKKLNPCPEIGSQIFGDVNGTGFSVDLKSTKKPNKVTVDL